MLLCIWASPSSSSSLRHWSFSLATGHLGTGHRSQAAACVWQCLAEREPGGSHRLAKSSSRLLEKVSPYAQGPEYIDRKGRVPLKFDQAILRPLKVVSGVQSQSPHGDWLVSKLQTPYVMPKHVASGGVQVAGLVRIKNHGKTTWAGRQAGRQAANR